MHDRGDSSSVTTGLTGAIGVTGNTDISRTNSDSYPR
jgi:hypothetical protein